MNSPLSPLSPSRTNRNAPENSGRIGGTSSPSKHPPNAQDENQPFGSPDGPPSSPFIADVSLPPSKPQTPSPTKLRSPKKAIQVHEPRALTEDALRENDGLSRKADTLDDENIDPSIRNPREEDTISTIGGAPGFQGMDDTCFSAFSAVPNADMTRFANLGQSPTKSSSRSPVKHSEDEGPTPRPKSRNTPSRPREHYHDEYSSPTPRRQKMHYDDDTTNLLDFTDQFSIARNSEKSPHKYARTSPLKSQTHQDLSIYASSRRTPSPAKYALPPGTPSESRHLAHLLDFDLTPAPTPRSIPSITARELESMKSNFLSQISSLTATLSGREAEVKALSTAVTDAERRVGEALEEIRNEKGAKEGLQTEKGDLEKRQKEMQKVLQDVKEEIIAGDREKDALLQRVQEAEYKREEAEARAVEAESKVEGMKSQTPASTNQQPDNGSNTNAEVEAAVTKVAKELHGLYKSKHETKVTALKKSYSDRWEKKVKDLQTKVDELSKENDELRVGRDATMTGVLPGSSVSGVAESEEQKAQKAVQQKEHEEQRQRLDLLEKELMQTQRSLAAGKEENHALQSQLSAAREEIEELISATEELMQLSQAGTNPSTSSYSDNHPTASMSQDIKSSLSRSLSGSSGLKAPGFGGGSYGGESRIGKGSGFGGNFPKERSGSGLGTRSGIMSNIERMGRGRVVD